MDKEGEESSIDIGSDSIESTEGILDCLILDWKLIRFSAFWRSRNSVEVGTFSSSVLQPQW